MTLPDILESQSPNQECTEQGTSSQAPRYQLRTNRASQYKYGSCGSRNCSYVQLVASEPLDHRLARRALQNGATPTMIAGFATINAHMPSQAAHPDVLFTITSSIGSLERSASFHDGTWHGYDLTHDLINRRSHQTYGDSTRPPMNQERSLRLSPATMQPITHSLLPARSTTIQLYLTSGTTPNSYIPYASGM